MAATHYTGKDGEIKIDTVVTTLVDFSIDISVGVIASGRIGKVSDKKYPGKKDITGKITQVLITGDLLAKLIGDTSTITTSTTEALLAATDLDAADREELAVTTDPTDPTSVKYTLTVGSEANTTAGSVVLHGTDVDGNYVTEVIDFDAMTVGDAAQVKNGTQIFKTTDYIDVEAALESGTTVFSTIKLDGVTGTKTITPGTSTMFDIIGKVVDSDGNYFQMTANNCFFTGGNFPIADAETLVQTDLPFVIQDPDSDVSLVWTST